MPEQVAIFDRVIIPHCKFVMHRLLPLNLGRCQGHKAKVIKAVQYNRFILYQPISVPTHTGNIYSILKNLHVVNPHRAAGCITLQRFAAGDAQHWEPVD